MPRAVRPRSPSKRLPRRCGGQQEKVHTFLHLLGETLRASLPLHVSFSAFQDALAVSLGEMPPSTLRDQVAEDVSRHAKDLWVSFGRTAPVGLEEEENDTISDLNLYTTAGIEQTLAAKMNGPQRRPDDVAAVLSVVSPVPRVALAAAPKSARTPFLMFGTLSSAALATEIRAFLEREGRTFREESFTRFLSHIRLRQDVLERAGHTQPRTDLDDALEVLATKYVCGMACKENEATASQTIAQIATLLPSTRLPRLALSLQNTLDKKSMLRALFLRVARAIRPSDCSSFTPREALELILACRSGAHHFSNEHGASQELLRFLEAVSVPVALQEQVSKHESLVRADSGGPESVRIYLARGASLETLQHLLRKIELDEREEEVRGQALFVVDTVPRIQPHQDDEISHDGDERLHDAVSESIATLTSQLMGGEEGREKEQQEKEEEEEEKEKEKEEEQHVQPQAPSPKVLRPSRHPISPRKAPKRSKKV